MRPGLRRLLFLSVASAALVVGCALPPFTPPDVQQLVAAGNYEGAIARLEMLDRENRGRLEYRVDIARIREQGVDALRRSGEANLAAGKLEEAANDFNRALALNPYDERSKAGLATLASERRRQAVMAQAQDAFRRGDLDLAQERLRLVLMETPQNRSAQALRRQIEEARVKEGLAEPVLRSRMTKPVTVQFRDANLKLVLDALSRSSGINFILDREVKGDAKTTVYARNVAVEDAIDMILLPNQLEKKVMSDNTVLIYPSTSAKLREYQDLVVKSFYLENSDAKSVLAMIKTMLKTKDVYIDEKLNMVMMRDTPDAVRLAEKLVAAQDLAEPEVVLEVAVLEVNRTRLEEIGIKWPDTMTFTLLDLNGPPSTIGDLFGINRNRIGVSPMPSATLSLRLLEGNSNLLSNPRIRVKNRERARILVGDRLPVISAIVTPSTGAAVTSESVSYLDVGLKLDIEPTVFLDGDVSMKVNLEVSNATNRQTTRNGTTVYDIGTRNASTVLRLHDGETQVLMGLIGEDDRRAANKVPGLGSLPLLGRLFSNNSGDQKKTEIVLSITPRIVRNVQRASAQTAEFWSGTDAALRTQPIALRGAALAAGAPAAAAAVGAAPVELAVAPAATAVVPAAGAAVAANAAPASGAAATGATAAPAAGVAVPAGASARGVELRWTGPTQVRMGEDLTLQLNARLAEPLMGALLQVAFDPEAFTVAGVQDGGLLAAGGARVVVTHRVDGQKGRVLVSVGRSEQPGATGDGALIALTLKPRGPAPRSPVELIAVTPVGGAGSSLTAATGAKHEFK
jgi:general secretion pathway protein D